MAAFCAVLHPGIGIEEAVEVLREFHEVSEGLDPTGNNLGHMMYLEDHFAVDRRDLRRMSLRLASIFRATVTPRDVEEYQTRSRRTSKYVNKNGVNVIVSERSLGK